MSAVDLVKWLVDLLHFIFIYRRCVVTCQHSWLSSITMLYKTPFSGNILTFGTFWPSFRHFPSPKYIVCWAETSKKIFLHIWYNILCKKNHPKYWIWLSISERWRFSRSFVFIELAWSKHIMLQFINIKFWILNSVHCSQLKMWTTCCCVSVTYITQHYQ